MWFDDENIIVNVIFPPEDFRCIISGPSGCGKTFLLKNLVLEFIQFDRLYIIGPTGNQYDYLKYKDTEFIIEIKELPAPDKLPEDIKKLIIFDDVRAKEPVINEYFCRGRHNNCNMIYINQNLFSYDRQNVRANCNIFVLLRQRGNVEHIIYNSFLMLKIVIINLLIYVLRCGNNVITILSSICL